MQSIIQSAPTRKREREREWDGVGWLLSADLAPAASTRIFLCNFQHLRTNLYCEDSSLSLSSVFKLFLISQTLLERRIKFSASSSASAAAATIDASSPS